MILLVIPFSHVVRSLFNICAAFLIPQHPSHGRRNFIKNFFYNVRAGCFCSSPAQRVDLENFRQNV